MLVLLLANLIVLPVAISFFNDDLSTHWIIFNCVSDAVFLADLIINFRTGTHASLYCSNNSSSILTCSPGGCSAHRYIPGLEYQTNLPSLQILDQIKSNLLTQKGQLATNNANIKTV